MYVWSPEVVTLPSSNSVRPVRSTLVRAVPDPMAPKTDTAATPPLGAEVVRLAAPSIAAKLSTVPPVPLTFTVVAPVRPAAPATENVSPS